MPFVEISQTARWNTNVSSETALTNRFQAKREQLKINARLSLESQGQNLALTDLYVPCSLVKRLDASQTLEGRVGAVRRDLPDGQVEHDADVDRLETSQQLINDSKLVRQLETSQMARNQSNGTELVKRLGSSPNSHNSSGVGRCRWSRSPRRPGQT